MGRYDRARWRAAMLVRAQLMRRRHFQIGSWVQAGTTPISAFDRCQHLQRRLQRAERRNLDAAADRTRRLMVTVLSDLRFTLESVLNQLHRPLPLLPGLRDIAAELDALEEEFGNLTIDLAARRIEVHTEPIELEGLYLGPFAIQLELGELGQPGSSIPLFVVALEPQPAAGDSHVTHPHVSDERLCAGEAYASMQHTLAEGRLSEFFMLVRSVLSTYNRDSPYVAIEEWTGEPCHDGGCRLDDEDRCSCEQCDRTFCDTCISRCRHCDEAICGGCMSRCDRCREPICDGCLHQCADCRRYVCPDCIDDDQCAGCLQAAAETDDDPQPDQQENDHEPTQTKPHQIQPSPAARSAPSAGA